ncbi:MAG: OmpA family protein [Myxococcota bacterium]
MIWFLLATLSQAQTTGGAVPELNGQLYRPSLDGDRTLWANDSLVRPTGTTTVRGLVHYARDPVVYFDDTGTRTQLVSDLLQGSILIGHARGPVRIGLDVPVYFRSGGTLGGETGLGDIAPDLKIRLRNNANGGVGVAAAGRAVLPTATVKAPLGNGNFGYEFEGILDGVVGRTLLVANLGLRGVPTAELENVIWDDALSAKLGVSTEVSDRSGVSLELAGLLGVRNVSEPAALPAEALAGFYSRVSDGLVLRAGVGAGITPGIGSPQFRAILGLGYEPKPISDRDMDGIVDRLDQCPDIPEDPDRYEDLDGCPEPTSVRVLVVNSEGDPVNARVSLGDEDVPPGRSIDMEAGVVPLAVVAPGYKPVARSVKIPDGAPYEIRVEVEPEARLGGLLVKAVDPENNPVPGARYVLSGPAEREGPVGEEQTLPAGDYEVVATAPGYRAARIDIDVRQNEIAEVVVKLTPAKVVISGERIDLKDSVYFNTNKATIKPVSYELLDEVAEILNAHPELTKIRIEGHTDSRGSNSYNLDLSKRRAASVRAYLIEHGVEPDRLESQGFGETKPLKSGNNESAWSVNRRVDFFVVDRSDD